ncbi:tRNA methylation protein [Apiospora hydei]|uniref:tRNA methylation protein n=1 Tax=Apiospora hydei TaxID=1337664 RepID=A0ABR1X1X8_9PEZI
MAAIDEATANCFPDLGQPSFNPKHAATFIEGQPLDVHAALARHVFRGLLDIASKPKQSSGNACAKLCGFVEQCSKSGSSELNHFAFAEKTSIDLFDFFVEWNEQDQHRAMRMVLDVLNIAITKTPTPPAVKSAMTALDHFLQKKLLYLPAVLDIYRDVHRNDRSLTVNWESFIAKIFDWMELQYVWPIAGKLLVTIFTCPWDEAGERRFHPDAWHRFLRQGLAANVEYFEVVKLYVLMPIFKSDHDQAMKYLDLLFSLQNLTSEDRSDLGLDSILWLATLEAGKKVGAVGEPSDDSDSQLAANVLEDILCHSSHEARSSAVSILIASPSTSRPHAVSSLDLLRKHLPAFHADTDAKFRYDERAMKKTSKKGMSAAEIAALTKEHVDFVNWYIGFLKDELVPTSSYQRHITSLKAMEFVLNSGVLQGDLPKGDQTESAFPLLDTTWLRAVLDLIMDPFDDVRETASSFVATLSLISKDSSADTPIRGLPQSFVSELDEFCRQANALASRTSRADHSDGVARLYKLSCQWATTVEDKLLIPAKVVDDLETRLSSAEKDLAAAVLQTPVHGGFAALRYIWEALSKTKYTQEDLQALETLQTRCLKCCDRVWQLVRHVLCDDSPEGHLPEELEEVDGLDTKDLLSYSFRAVHESSNLLRAIANNAPFQGKPGLLAPDSKTFDAIGNLTFDELSNLRHRGAFSTGAIHCIYSQASTTRRSAGIPALIVGILSANAENPSFTAVMEKLRSIAKEPALISQTDGSNLPQVHALNCIKDIFKSSYLSKRAEPYLTESLQLAATSLRSEVLGWTHNENRVAQVQGPPGSDSEPPRVGPTIHHNAAGRRRYSRVGVPRAGHNSTSWPPEEFKDTLFGLVASYLDSRFWHVREIAARTLCSFLLKPDWIQHIRDLLSESHFSANRLHGTLLTFKFLLERLRDVMPEQLQLHLKVLPEVLEEVGHANNSLHVCAEARAVYFETVTIVNSLDIPAQPGETELSGLIRPTVLSGFNNNSRARIGSALLGSKHAQCVADFDIRQVASGAESPKALRLDGLVAGDVNVACDTGDATRIRGASDGQCGDFCTPCDTVHFGMHGQGDLVPSKADISALWADLQAKPMNPGLADAIVEGSGPILAAVVVSSGEAVGEDTQQWMRSWGEMMSRAGLADNTFDNRMAAALSLGAFSRHVKFDSKHDAHLPWLLALYDALNDDDEEIREVAAAATEPIPGEIDEFRTQVACRMMGHYPLCSRLSDTVLGKWQPAEQQLASAMRFDDSLFVIEEQNLYIDEVREARRWREAFRGVSYKEDSAVLAALVEWARSGLQTLTRLAERDDGVLGWASKPEVYAICARVVILGAALAGSHPAVKEELQRFFDVGHKTRVHGLLLSMCELDSAA